MISYAYLRPDDPLVAVMRQIALAQHPPESIEEIVRNPRFKAIPIAALRYAYGPVLIPPRGDDPHRNPKTSEDLVPAFEVMVRLERVEILCGERPDLVGPTELWLVLHHVIIRRGADLPRMAAVGKWASYRAIESIGRYRDEPIVQAQQLAEHIAHRSRLWAGSAATALDDETVFRGPYADAYADVCGQIMDKVIYVSRRMSGLALTPDNESSVDQEGSR